MSGASRSPGEEFAEALATKDFARAAEVLDPDVDFRALTPNFSWQASVPDDVVTSVLREWFEDSDEVEELLSYEAEPFADREHISYRIRGRNEDGPYVLEQQAYLAAEAGRIIWMRVLCSGKRPMGAASQS
jgi:hypothetical protein